MCNVEQQHQQQERFPTLSALSGLSSNTGQQFNDTIALPTALLAPLTNCWCCCPSTLRTHLHLTTKLHTQCTPTRQAGTCGSPNVLPAMCSQEGRQGSIRLLGTAAELRMLSQISPFVDCVSRSQTPQHPRITSRHACVCDSHRLLPNNSQLVIAHTRPTAVVDGGSRDYFDVALRYL